MPIELAGIAGIAAIGVAFYLVRNYMLDKANSGQSIPLIGKQKREWVNALTGGTLVAAVLVVGAFAMADQYGYVSGIIPMLKALPVIGPSMPFTASMAAVTTTTLPGVPNPNAPTQNVPSGTCIGLAQTPALTVLVNDQEKPGLSVIEAGSYRKKGTSTWNLFMPGTKISAIGSAGEVYQVALCLNQSQLTGSCYGTVFDYTVKCQEEDKLQKSASNDVASGSVTTAFYNEDELNAVQTMQMGSSATVFLQYETPANTVFGNPYIGDYLPDTVDHRAKYPNVLLLQLNKTTMNKPEKVWIFQSPVSDEVNVQLKQISCPNIATSVADTTNYCYEAPVIRDSRVRIAVKLVANSNHAPANDAVASLMPGTFYVNTDTGDLAWGVEDNNQAAVGSATTVDTVINLA